MTDSSFSFWNREVQAPTHSEWMALPAVRSRINRKIGGREETWPLDWFAEAYPGLHFARALSIGCGAGALERDLLRRGLCDTVDAFDGSIASLAVARAAAAEAGLDGRVRYFAADFNRPALPSGHYDAVFVHQALHHVAKLEKLLRAVRRALRPQGLLYLEEYVGPSASDWTAAAIAPLAADYARLPAEVRRYDRLPPPINSADPSEAIRSREIRHQLGIGFAIEHERGYGGNLLAVILPALDLAKLDDALLERLQRDEDVQLARGELDFYAVLVSRPRRGPRGVLADLRYFVEPKVKRLGRELAKLFGRA